VPSTRKEFPKTTGSGTSVMASQRGIFGVVKLRSSWPKLARTDAVLGQQAGLAWPR